MAEPHAIQLGHRVEEQITGNTGIVTRITEHFTGCDRIGVTLEDSNGSDETFYFPPQLEIIKETTEYTDTVTSDQTTAGVALGDVVEHQLTGDTGIVTSLAFNLFNCPRAALDQRDPEPGYERNRNWYDTPQLAVTTDESYRGMAGEYRDESRSVAGPQGDCASGSRNMEGE